MPNTASPVNLVAVNNRKNLNRPKLSLNGPIIYEVENLLEEIEEEGHITKRDFDSKCDHFYEICYNYIYNWSESNNHNSGLKDLLWVTLTSKIIVTWSNAKNSIRFLTTICNTICVEENNFFEQFKMFEKYFKEQSEEWHNISLKEYVKFSFSLPGSNAAVERVFSLMNSTWTKSRNKLDVSTVEATLMIKISFDNMSCCQFYESILANKTLLQKVHSSAKYQTTQDFSADGEHIGHRLKVLYFIIKQCSKFYKPAQNLTVDEGICPFRGRISFRVYMKNKPQKYGMKLYILSDPETGYTLNFETHSVLKHLWNKQTNAVGTVMSNRKNLPKDLIKQKLLKGEITFARCRPQMFLKWKDTRDVLVMSTVHNADLAPVTVRSKVGPLEKFKPQLANQSDSYPQFNEVSNLENRLKGRHFISKIPPTLSKVHPRRVCKVCAEKAKRSTGNRGRKETSYYCSSCNTPLCVDECFEIYHIKQNYWI
ncbi:hypothetical protein QTP88_013581 [Uroleucon formosanum]